MKLARHTNSIPRSILFILVSVVLLPTTGIFLNGCGSAASLPPVLVSTDIPTNIPTETKITPSATLSPGPTQHQGLSPEQVQLGWANPTNLDSKHQDIQCTACHSTENQYEPPLDSTCLECHGGSYAAVTDLTKEYKPINPHDYHYTTSVTCSFCHIMHEPQDSSCGFCHVEKQLTRPSITPKEAPIDPNNTN